MASAAQQPDSHDVSDTSDTGLSVQRPPLFAVLDLGSRALRFGISEDAPDGESRRLETLEAPIALGDDTFREGRIRSQTMDQAVEALRKFCLVLSDYGLSPSDCHVIATTAVREAKNREVFLERVETRTGLRVNVIDAIEEARLVHQHCVNTLGKTMASGDVLLVALGAGGTHVAYQRNRVLTFAHAYPFGSLKLLARYGTSQHGLRAARRYLDTRVADIVRQEDLSDASTLVVVQSALARMARELAGGRQTRSRLTIPISGFNEIGEKLATATPETLLQDYGIEEKAARTALMAYQQAAAIVAVTRVEKVVFPSGSMLDSLLLDRRLNSGAGSSAAAETHRVEQVAWSVARKYRVDEPHAAKVHELAMSLFTAMQSMTGLGQRSKLLLGVAAILHDIGAFVAPQQQERHSAYLVRHSEVMGLSAAEMKRVAAITRYHRGPCGDFTEMEELAGFATAERLEILKIAAVLRMAYALNVDHRQRVSHVRIDSRSGGLLILAHTRSGDRHSFADIARAFGRQCDLCRELFGVEPRLSEVIAS